MSKIKINGKTYITAMRNGKPYLRSAMTTVAAPPDPFADIRADLIASLGEEAANDMIAKMVAKGVKVRPTVRRKSVPTARADGDGGICPHFGVPQHWIKIGQDSNNEDVKAGRCGFRRDGHYAKKAGFDAHMANIVPARLVKTS